MTQITEFIEQGAARAMARQQPHAFKGSAYTGVHPIIARFGFTDCPQARQACAASDDAMLRRYVEIGGNVNALASVKAKAYGRFQNRFTAADFKANAIRCGLTDEYEALVGKTTTVSPPASPEELADIRERLARARESVDGMNDGFRLPDHWAEMDEYHREEWKRSVIRDRAESAMETDAELWQTAVHEVGHAWVAQHACSGRNVRVTHAVAYRVPKDGVLGLCALDDYLASAEDRVAWACAGPSAVLACECGRSDMPNTGKDSDFAKAHGEGLSHREVEDIEIRVWDHLRMNRTRLEHAAHLLFENPDKEISGDELRRRFNAVPADAWR